MINKEQMTYLVIVLIYSMSLFLMITTKTVSANEVPETEQGKTNSIITPYQIPTFTGDKVDWLNIKPTINPLPKTDGDYIFKAVLNCYPDRPWGIELSLKAGLNFRETVENEIGSTDTSRYYAGIVFNMPLYSASERDKATNREYKRRTQIADVVGKMLKAVAEKRRAERLMGLYVSLEKRSQARVRNGIAPVEEQIGYLEKVAINQSSLDHSISEMEGARISLIGQCRPGMRNRVNEIIKKELNL